MTSAQYFTITLNNNEQRIDNYLISILKNVPKSHIYKIIRKGEVRVNMKRIKPEYKLKLDDTVRIPPVKIFTLPQSTPSTNLKRLILNSIIEQNDNMLVLNKPAGIAVHGGSGNKLGVIETIRKIHPEHNYFELVHRLDKATSGCLIIAKKRSFLRYLQNEFRHRRVKKKYSAIMLGTFKNTIKCHQPLQKTITKQGDKIVKVNPQGKQATTIFTPTKVIKNKLVLADIEIISGRTHQIRVHAQFINHNILGDQKYGNDIKNDQYKTNRMFLHAKSLKFKLQDGSNFFIEAKDDFEFWGHNT